MTSEEARIGLRVRVRDSLLRSELRGKAGTITGRWGHTAVLAPRIGRDETATLDTDECPLNGGRSLRRQGRVKRAARADRHRDGRGSPVQAGPNPRETYQGTSRRGARCRPGDRGRRAACRAARRASPPRWGAGVAGKPLPGTGGGTVEAFRAAGTRRDTGRSSAPLGGTSPLLVAGGLLRLAR